MLLVLTTSPWGFSKLWDGGVPTSDIYHSGPRLRCLLLLLSLALPPHLIILPFYGYFFLPYFLPPPHLQHFLFEYLSIFTPPNLLSWCKTPPTWTLTASTSFPCLLCRVPEYSAIPVPVHSPFCRPRPAPRSLSAPLEFACCGSLCVRHSCVWGWVFGRPQFSTIG